VYSRCVSASGWLQAWAGGGESKQWLPGTVELALFTLTGAVELALFTLTGAVEWVLQYPLRVNSAENYGWVGSAVSGESNQR
jgi:hypothetical protein